MKEHAKKALKHDTKVLGKTVPTMLIIGLFLVGGGSAAILSSFGTVSGTADVGQALTVDSTAIDGEENPSVDASYHSDDIAAGSTVTSEHRVQSNVDAVSATVETTVDDNGPSSVGGVDASSILYSQVRNNKEDESYDVKVKKAAPLNSEGDYSVKVTSEDESTQDYATVWYGLPEETTLNDYTLKYDALPVDDKADDELYLVTEDGEKYSLTMSSATVDSSDDYETVELDFQSDTTTYGGKKLSEIGNVVAIGIGQGDASAPFHSDGGTTVDVTIDNVRLAGGSDIALSEQASYGMTFLETGQFTGTADEWEEEYEYDFNREYGFTQVTGFAIDVVPNDYEVETMFKP